MTAEVANFFSTSVSEAKYEFKLKVLSEKAGFWGHVRRFQQACATEQLSAGAREHLLLLPICEVCVL